jgi:hypothetical protein
MPEAAEGIDDDQPLLDGQTDFPVRQDQAAASSSAKAAASGIQRAKHAECLTRQLNQHPAKMTALVRLDSAEPST